MAKPEIKPPLKTYLDIAWSFVHGLIRLWGAEAASARLMCALTEFHGSERSGIDGSNEPVLRHLDRIPYSSYDSLAYVTGVSHLVYATTLLDTFLSDTTLFLFLLNPGSLGKNQQLPLRMLLDASSRNEAITEAANARNREIGYLPFPARLQFLRDTFGLVIELDPDCVEVLTHYPSVRNTAVHDQGIYELRLDDHGQVESRQKTCLRHPTKVSGEDVFKAIKGYERVASTVAWAVFSQVLKEQDHPVVQHFLNKSGTSARKLNSLFTERDA